MKPVKAENQSNKTAENLLQVVWDIVTEVHPLDPPIEAITLDSTFEKDLGLGSLVRVELISRVETEFKLALPERTFAEAETPRDLLRAVLGAVNPRVVLTTTETPSVKMGEVITESITAPAKAETLIDVLEWHVKHHADRPHIQMYEDDLDGEVISYWKLMDGASKLASSLQERGLKPAEPVAIMLPSGPDYFYSFFGILMAGGIPVPIYPPARPSQLEDHMRRHVRILSNCLANTLITVPEAKRVAQLLKSQAPNLQHIVSIPELMATTGISTPPVLSANDIAFIQYTSGSTGNPKGVILTHSNLLANIRAMGRVVNAGPKDVFISWLPLYHDMGLIGAWLGSLYYAALFVAMSPLSFLARPERWLWAIHYYRGTLSASPNFGYEYCLRRLKDKDLQGLDLSSWRAAFNGAEPVSPETIESFDQRFSAFSFNSKAMMPVYGLAESSVGLAFPPSDRGPLIDHIERSTFMRSGHAKPIQGDDKNALKFVSSGFPLSKHQIKVVDPAGHELPERQEGRLEFRGPSCTSGYYRAAEETQHLFDEDWLDSGDLAYITNGEVYITGRIKDIIIRAGRNIYPHELEETVGNIPGIRTGRVAVFGSEDSRTGTERLIVLAETHNKDAAVKEKLRSDINILVTDLIGSPPDEVVLAPPGTVLKTSSGKIRRAASREIYIKGAIGKNQPGVSWQVVRLALTSIIPQIQRSLRYIKSTLFAVYAWCAYGVLAPIVWLSSTLLPVFSWRWSVMCDCAQLLAKATATPIKINGLENLPTDGQVYVLAANHASYLDSYALVAMLPGHFRFIAKAELAESFINRVPLKGIHTEFVERFETSKGIQDTRHLSSILKAEDVLMFFVEGTFTRIPGLRPFYLGAFTVAAEAGVPVIPVAIRGTRSILRSGSWFPHQGSINLEIGQPIYPQEITTQPDKDTWHVAIEMRDRCREFILHHCGEPDLSRHDTTLH